MSYGRFAVIIFIALSCFSLGLGLARSGWRCRPGYDSCGEQARRRRALAGRAAHEIKLVGDVDQLTRSQLPAAHGQPVGQVRRF
jgi:hypothetical protein